MELASERSVENRLERHRTELRPRYLDLDEERERERERDLSLLCNAKNDPIRRDPVPSPLALAPSFPSSTRGSPRKKKKTHARLAYPKREIRRGRNENVRKCIKQRKLCCPLHQISNVLFRLECKAMNRKLPYATKSKH